MTLTIRAQIGQCPMKEIAATIHLHNNRLLERRLSMGWSQVELSRRIGMCQSTYSKFERMAESPIAATTGLWKKRAIKIAKFWGEAPEEIFPQSVHNVKRSTAHAKFDSQDVVLTSASARLLAGPPDEVCISKQLMGRIQDTIDEKLTVLERTVIQYSFGIGVADRVSDVKISKMCGCSSQHIQETRTSAIKKIRMGSRMGKDDAQQGDTYIVNNYYRSDRKTKNMRLLRKRYRDGSVT